jgi:phosphate-selective porin OprO/OprP
LRSLSLALLASLAVPVHAEVALDVIAESEIAFEGLFQADGNWFSNDYSDLNAVGANGDGSEFAVRRAEMVVKGKGPGNIEWVAGYDASSQKSVVVSNDPAVGTTTVNSQGKWLDVNARYKIGGNPNHYVQAGQFKQPNSLEELGSTRHNDFISKAMVTNTFGVARRVGVAYRYGDVNWGVTGSYFGRELTRNLAQGQGFGLRGTWAPINEAGNILHFGASYVDFDTDLDTVRIRARPDADLSVVRLVDTGNLTNVDRQSTLGAEAMYVHGPFKVQAEYMQSSFDRYDNGNPRQSDDFDGSSGYISGLWNITGETWTYRDGVSITPLPNEPAKGMWQVGLRYDTIDLDDGDTIAGSTPTSAFAIDGVLGGQMDTWTVGVNWYWRSNFKFMANYVKVDSSRFFARTPAAPYADDPADNNQLVNREVDDNPDIFELRMQFYF